MRILILGSTGPCGILLTRECLAQFADCTIVLYARPTSVSKIPPDIQSHNSVTIATGSLEDEEALSKAISDSPDTVILSALGPSTSPKSALLYPSNTPLTNAYKLILSIMRKKGLNRLILLGTPTMKDQEHDKSDIKFSALVGGIMVLTRNVYKDVCGINDIVRSDAGEGAEWTIVRVPVLTNKSDREVIAGYIGDGKINSVYLSRAGFAKFVVDEIEKREWVKKSPLIISV